MYPNRISATPTLADMDRAPSLHSPSLAQAGSSRPHSRTETSSSWEQLPPGYARLAEYIAHEKDKSTMICRRFESLSVRNLLYLESELLELDAQLRAQDQKANEDICLRLGAQNWHLLKVQDRFYKTADPNAAQELKEKLPVDDENLRRIVPMAGETLNLARQIEDTLKRYCR